ncbi:MAG: hypothetical protein CMF12_05270 [Idiomarina sp.]|uniref:hypothetical protein n=1 Tax=Idiomarina sp. TaxID=1874361 RepID=UPI000C40F2AB|nr:hypothetical protein [Idiomarina sp.]MBT41914.1 hypothetical protein [Idiomarina sp.]
MNEEQIEKESFDLCHALGIRNDEEQQWLSNYLKSTVGLDNAMVTYLVTGNKLWEQSTAHNDPREKRFKRIKSALTSRRNRKKKKQNKVAISAWIEHSTRREFDRFMVSKGYLISDGLDSIIKMGIDNFRDYYEDEIQKHKEHIQEEYAKRLEKAKDINTTQRNRENQSLKRIRKFVLDEFIDKYSAKAIARGIALQALAKDLDGLIDREFDEDTRNNFKLVAGALEENIEQMYGTVKKYRNLQKITNLGELDDYNKSSEQLGKKAKRQEKKLNKERGDS